MIKIFLAVVALASNLAFAQDTSFRFSVLHTNDLHSHFEGSGPDSYFTPKVGDGDEVLGHYARISTLIKKIRNENREVDIPTLVFDAGDFYSGSLIHALSPKEHLNFAPELEFFSRNEYDAVSLGNHEFDAGEAALHALLQKANKLNFNVPIVTSNIKFNDDNNDLQTWIQPSQEFQGGTKFYKSLIKEIHSNGKTLRVGILGLVGPDAALVGSNVRKNVSFVGFDSAKVKLEIAEFHRHVKRLAVDLKVTQKADIVVVVAHSGSPEDTALAKAVPEVDLIIAGHTHEKYLKFEGKTVISQSGEYGKTLGRLDLNWNGKQLKVQNIDSTHIAVDDKVESDPAWLKRIEAYKTAINASISLNGLQYQTPIFELQENMSKGSVPGEPQSVERFATRAIQKQLGLELNSKIDFYFTATGLIRTGFHKVDDKPTRYQLSDIFQVFSIGYDENNDVGAPICEFYISKSDAKDLIEVFELYSRISSSFAPAFSDSVGYETRWWGIPLFNKIKNFTVDKVDLDNLPPLLHLATSTEVTSYFDTIPHLTYGLIDLVPRDENGKAVELKSRVTKYKEFLLLAKYLKANGQRTEPRVVQ